MFFAALFECIPIQKGWDPMIVTGHCFDPRITTYSNAGLNTFTDIYVLVVPLPAVWSLPLSAGRRFRVIAIFGLGVWYESFVVLFMAMLIKILQCLYNKHRSDHYDT